MRSLRTCEHKRSSKLKPESQQPTETCLKHVETCFIGFVHLPRHGHSPKEYQVILPQFEAEGVLIGRLSLGFKDF